jgi:hypothetical protein
MNIGNLKHGHCPHGKPSPTYYSWMNMKIRCKYPSHECFHNYGGLDITYDPRWEVFELFLADMGERPVGLTLDRNDNSRGYYKENCKWSTRAQQAQNSANTTMTWDKVRTIRRLYAERKLNQRQIGELLGVATHSVSMIVTNKCWVEND